MTTVKHKRGTGIPSPDDIEVGEIAIDTSTGTAYTKKAGDGSVVSVGGDGGSGGDPLSMSQNLNSIFGKMLRIEPLGNNSLNGEYGIPASNPFVNDGDDNTLAEIYPEALKTQAEYRNRIPIPST